MNKLIAYALMALMLSGIASAKVGSIDTECAAHGFDFGVAKWEYDGGWFRAEGDTSPWTTSVTGTLQEADWTADPAVDGVLVKAATFYEVYAGGTSGTVYGIEEVKPQAVVVHDISHVTLCANEEEIPEFGVIAASIAFVGAVAGFLILRKRD